MSLYPEKERIQLHPAFILHQRPYSNTSLLLDVLSKEHGRLSLIAKGARQPKSKFRGSLQPFQLISISWVRRTELGTLTHAELCEKQHYLEGELMYAALYLNELLTRVLINNDPVLDVFCAYAYALKSLKEKGIAPALRVFEYSLLQSLGFEIQLDHDTEQNPILADRFYKFIPEHGFVKSNEKNVFLFQGTHIQAFNNQEFETGEVLKTAQLLMQTGLKKIIGNEPLRSRELFKAYNKMTNYNTEG